ncbi:GntR family transcriptional regulator [Williamsia deligens]|uniref:GntR family transcriptional regulator n=1 Tax=Williamsia deligens TaxID=321325 RepID=A0ABW3G238_9NOCA|nr:GntR family transcriptional regulator [Williamsia deligens]MCP2194939.1 DNA-binding transcriptional regulator, GntR family [Williamsia deligens]
MERAVDRAYALIRAAILDGRYGPGARLGESELADVTQTSRTPVREALRQLEVEGLVEVLPHRGARVYAFTSDDLDEIYDLRMTLEALAAGRAASRITPAQVERMAQLCDEMEQAASAADLDAVAAANLAFHTVVRDASASTRLASMLGAVTQLPLMMRTFHRYAPEDLARSAGHHRELVAALHAGDDVWADAVMRSHVRAAKAVLLASLRADVAESAEARTVLDDEIGVHA